MVVCRLQGCRLTNLDHCWSFSLVWNRAYVARIKRPFSVRFDPFTCSIEVLDSPLKIRGGLECMKDELKMLTDALNVLE